MTEIDYIALILASLGGDTADGLLATNLPIYWEIHADIADPNVRALATKLNAIDLLLGNTWRQVDFKALDGASVNLSDMFDHLLKLRDATQAALDVAAIADSAGGAVGELLKTAPIMPPALSPFDANDRAYRGDPYTSRRRRWGP